jgi:hypothetical protein
MLSARSRDERFVAVTAGKPDHGWDLRKFTVSACQLDHLVVAAASLKEGARFIRDRFGVDIPQGGRHEIMGTHNCLMRLGKNSYLEVISVDPYAHTPDCPRWYALDEPEMRAKLDKGPCLIAWVLRSADIISSVKASAVPLGAVIPVRRGSLNWRLTVPADGHLPGGGVVPSIIEWDGYAEPWETMNDFGCQLVGLNLKHPDPEWLKRSLLTLCPRGFSFISFTAASAPALAARISAPSAIVNL